MDEWRLTLSPKEKDAIAALRQNIEDIRKEKHDDVYLYRFLKARKFDLKKAEKMLRESEKWRAEYGTDTLLESWEPPEVMRKHWPGGVFGFDKLGHPILWQLSKDFDSKEMMKCVKKADILKYHVWRMEKVVKAAKESSKKRGKVIYKSLHISDLDGFSMGQMFTAGLSEAMKEVFAVLEANYPENLHSSYVINAPGVFPAIFNILKPFLSQETKQKVHILGSNWKDELFKEVEPSELPVFWGGSAMIPDDRCSDHITHCSKIPQKYYLSEQLGVDRSQLTCITVIRGSSYNLSYDVNKPNSVISWVFETDGHDIGFAVLYCENRQAYKNRQMKKLRSTERCASHVAPEDGTLTCAKSGVYVLQFDNTYSWVTNKQVFYDVEVLEPDEEISTQQRMTVAATDINQIEDMIESTYL